jgi:hypothetical protein
MGEVILQGESHAFIMCGIPCTVVQQTDLVIYMYKSIEDDWCI